MSRCVIEDMSSFYVVFAFSALTLSVGWQEGHPACKTERLDTGLVICLNSVLTVNC